MTRKELLQKIKAIGPLDEDTRNEVVCAMIGHSNIQTVCFGYFHCARCGQLVGDNLAGIYENAENIVIVGHDCDKCRENFKKLTWRDKLYCPNPFGKEKEQSHEPTQTATGG